MENKLLNKEELYNQLFKYDKSILIEVFDKLIVEYDESELSSEEKLLLEEREDYKNQYNMLVSSLKILASPYEVQKNSLPSFVDIVFEVTDDFAGAFLLSPQLIENDFINKQGVASIIRCFNRMEILLRNEEFWDIELFKNHERWNEIRNLAKKALKDMNENSEML